MVCPLDPVNEGVPHVHVGMGHVDFSPQYAVPVRVNPLSHLVEKLEVFLYRTAAMGAGRPRFGRCPLPFGNVLSRLMVDICQTFFNQTDRKSVELFEIVTGIEFTSRPFVAKPCDVTSDGVHIFLTFFFGVGVVEAQIDEPLILFGKSKGETDGFGVANVQIAIGFRWKPGVDVLVSAVLQIILDDLFNEVDRFRWFSITVIRGLLD